MAILYLENQHKNPIAIADVQFRSNIDSSKVVLKWDSTDVSRTLTLDI